MCCVSVFVLLLHFLASKALRVEGIVEHLELCFLCRHRLLHGSSFHCYGCPENLREKMKGALSGANRCVLCFGLCNSIMLPEAEARCLSEILKEVKNSGVDFSTFKLSVSEPANLALRDQAFWAYVREKCKDENCVQTIRILEEEAVSAKIVFRNLIYNRLRDLLQEEGVIKPPTFLESGTPTWFDVATEQVDILVTFDLSAELPTENTDLSHFLVALKKHCQPSSYATYLSGSSEELRRRTKYRRCLANEVSEISRTSLKKLMGLLPDKVLLEEVINLERDQLERYQSPTVRLASVKVSRSAPLLVAGRYAKLNRYLPQTPWFLDGERKLDSSVEELISAPITASFGPNTTFAFISSGREDIDVRCLGLGRPFALELNTYNRTISSVLQFNKEQRNEMKNSSNILQEHLNNLSWLSNAINRFSGNRVLVRDLQVVSEASVNAFLKGGEIEKRKRYRALCWCPQGGLTTERVRRLDYHLRAISSGETDEVTVAPSTLHWPPTEAATYQPDLGCSVAYLVFGRFTIRQLTPVRVIHRRSLLSRTRDIIWLRLTDFETNVLRGNRSFVLREFVGQTKVYPKEELFLLELCCDAGTYVKELVHGDLGRTHPSLSSLLGCPVDLIALDVTAVEQDWPPKIA